ncbi:glyoxylate/hydroxypyruvate reductase HPR3 [Brassica napus]|uniref:glyoxylate/hydroxypyruvate reductase HPR3 n=1 Tax=Brassica napus TaxID=3708 RepID=UPI00207914B6|nr:glyoxylate/hydroxypyruvate reductase HPR3 [Brassica napus]
MAEESPLVLVHRPPTMKYMDEPLTRYYRILTTHTSSDPLPLFLSRHASSVRAVVSIGRFTIDAGFLSRLPSLQLIVCTSVGTDHVDLPECNRRGIAVTNAGEAYSEDVADYAVGLLISFLRRIPAADRYVRSGEWAKCGEFQLGIKLSGKRVGILGLGSIGSLIPYQYYPDVVSLAANSDVIILCCALNDQTRHIVNREVMEALGKKGVIINVGRGGLIDEKEMVKCLVDGVIGGAGLDVFEKEPGVPEELFGLDNVVLSPHAAMATPGSLNNIAQLTLANLKAFFSNQPLISPVRLD